MEGHNNYVKRTQKDYSILLSYRLLRKLSGVNLPLPRQPNYMAYNV